MIILIFFFFSMVRTSGPQLEPSKSREEIDKIHSLIGKDLDPPLSHFLSDYDKWKSLNRQNRFFNEIENEARKYYGPYTSRNPTSQILSDVFLYLNDFITPGWSSGYLYSLNPLYTFLYNLEKLHKDKLETFAPESEKKTADNLFTPSSFVEDLLKFFKNYLYSRGAELFDDQKLLNELKAICSKPPPTKPLDSNRQTTPTGWSTTKKALVFGGSGIGALLLIGLGLFFAFGKSRVSTSAS